MNGPDFYRKFRPLTAHPYDREDCRELAPGAPLRPMVRCYWGPRAVKPRLVVPDGCVDVILTVENGRVRARLCPLDRRPYWTSGGMRDMLGVRFYFWALAYARSDQQEALDAWEVSLTRAGYCEADFTSRVALVDAFLSARLPELTASATLLNAVDRLLTTRGRAAVGELADEAAVSTRTLERQFRQALDVSPKALAEVVRYQALWRRRLRAPRFDAQEAVAALGYADQAHLLNDFRRMHGLPLEEAVRQARMDVAFLQDKP